MRLIPHNDDSLRFVTPGLVVLVAVISVLAALWLGNSAAERLRGDLSERSQSIAAALGSDDVMKLEGNKDDDGTAVYNKLKSRLADVKRANPDARSIYLMGRNDSRLFFYVDSEKPDSRDYSSAGEWYDDGTPEDSAMFDNKQPLVEGPVTDSYGTFISGLAPILNPRTKDVTAVIGIDVDATTYWRDIVLAALVPLMTGLSVVLIVLVFEGIRRRNMRLLALRSELVSVASHELRNPITGIRWASESLLKLINGERPLRLVKAIYSSAESLENSTDDILELSHAMNQRDLNIVPTDMTKIIRDVIATQSLSAARRGVSLDLDPSLPPELLIDCDPDHIKRALHNVVSNAIKYTQLNTNVIFSYKDAGDMHQLFITDQGIGIPADEQAKVFHGFYRASNAVASKIPGTGFGMYLVKAVFERHGGKVSLSSEENKGTTIILSLPKQRK